MNGVKVVVPVIIFVAVLLSGCISYTNDNSSQNTVFGIPVITFPSNVSLNTSNIHIPFISGGNNTKDDLAPGNNLPPDEYCREYISKYYFNGSIAPGDMALTNYQQTMNTRSTLFATWDTNEYDYSFSVNGTGQTAKAMIEVNRGSNSDKTLKYLEVNGEMKVSSI